MISALLLLRRLLFYRPLIVVLLLLVYSVGVLLFSTIDSDKRGLAVAIMAAFATAGLAAVLTERISRFSREAGTLGLPDHARVMYRVQVCFLALFVAMPVALACLLGLNPLAALAALIVATAVGIALATYGGPWFILVVILGKFFPLAEWAQQWPVQVLGAGASAYLIWLWFKLPPKAERAGGLADGRLADARHEKRLPTVLTDEQIGGAMTADLHLGRRYAQVLAFGFGYSLVFGSRALWIGTGISIAALAIWTVVHGSQPGYLAYLFVTAWCCIGVAGRLQGVMRRWMQTTTEQALLQLAPQWPAAGRIKRAVVETTIRVQFGAIFVWATATAVAALLGSIAPVTILWGLAAIVGTSLAVSGAVWAVLAQRRIRELHLSTVTIVLTVSIGTATVVFGGPIGGRSSMVGIAMMLIPPALALAVFRLAPLRFPLNVDPRALKAAHL